MGRQPRPRTVWFVGWAGLVACSSTFTSSELPVPPDGATADAAAEAMLADALETGASPDAGSEAALPDVAPDSADGPAGDASSDAGKPSLCGANFLFCDGFEHGLASWSQQPTLGGSLSMDSAHVYRGLYALHAHADAVVDAGTTAYADVQKDQAWPAHMFTRFFAYVPSPLTPAPLGLLNVIRQGGRFPGIELILEPTATLGMVTYQTGSDQSWQSASAASLDQWVCFELEIDLAAETVHVYVNDAEVTDLLRNNLALSPLGIVDVGLHLSQVNPQNAEDLWIDEVAVDGARIGCAR